MLVNSCAICFVVCPKSIIHIAIHMNEFTFAVSFVISPFPDVLRTVWPSLLSKSISKASFPLTNVDSSRAILISWSLHSWLIRPVYLFGHSFSSLIKREILARSCLFSTDQPYKSSLCHTSPPSLNANDHWEMLLQVGIVVVYFALALDVFSTALGLCCFLL